VVFRGWIRARDDWRVLVMSDHVRRGAPQKSYSPFYQRAAG